MLNPSPLAPKRGAKFVLQVLALFLSLAVLAGAAAYYVYDSAQQNESIRVRASEAAAVELGKGSIVRTLEGIDHDLLLAANHYALHRFLDRPEAETLRDFEQDMLNLSSSTRMYDQIRWLDETGMERVRINFNAGKPLVVPDGELQNKRSRDFFATTIKLERGETYYSPMDFNIEQGQMEIPYKPVLRFATPVFDSQGVKRGIAVLNYLGSILLERFNKATQTIADHAMLLNRDGYWLKSPRPDEEWGFVFGNHDLTFARRHPAAWRQIIAADSGQFEDAEGLWTFQTVYPAQEMQEIAGLTFNRDIQEAHAYFWKVVARLPPEVIYSQSRSLLKPAAGAFAGLLALLFAGSWKFTRVRERRNTALTELHYLNKHLEHLVEVRTAQLQTDIEEIARVGKQMRLQSAALEAAANAIVITDIEAVIEWANPAFTTLTGYALQEAIGKRPKELVKSGLQTQGFYQAMWETIKSGQVWRGEVINKRKDGTLYTEELTITPVHDEQGAFAHFIAVKEDISQRKRLEQRQLAQFQLLEKVGIDVPLTALLEDIVRFIEKQAPELLCSILLADELQGILRHGAAPSLPEAYNRLVDGLPIAEGCGSCGTASARRETVIVSDVRSDPLWVPYLPSVAEMEWLRACWSTPFFDSQRRLLGTFGVYAAESRAPNPDEADLIAYAVSLAGQVVERKRAEEALRESEERLRLFIEHAPAALAMFDRDMRYLAISQRWIDDYGLDDEASIKGRSHYEIFPEIPERWKSVHRRGLAGEVVQAGDDRFERFDGSVQWLCWEVRPWYTTMGLVGGIVIFTEDITERKRAEETMRQSQEQLRRAARAGNVGLWEWDLLTNQVFYSPEWKSQIGYEDKEISNDFSEWESRVHPDDLPRMLKMVQDYIAEPYPDYQAEFRFRHKDGSYRWILTNASLLYDEENRPVRMFGSHVDITELKEKENTLREKEFLLSESQRLAHVGSWWVDLATWQIIWSDESYRIYGISPEAEVPGWEGFLALLHPDDRSVMKDWCKACLAGEHPGELIFRAVLADGRVRILSGQGDLQYNVAGNPAYMIGTVQDITERKQTEDMLRASEARFKNLFEQANDGIFLISAANRYLEANSYGQAMLGYTREELLRMGVADVLTPRERPRLDIEPVLMMAGQPHLAEWEHLRKDGSTFPAEVSSRRLDDQSYLAIVRDLSERKRMENELRQASEKIQSIFSASTEVAIISCLQDGTIAVFNPGAERMLGYSAAEVVGRQTPAIWHLDSEMETRGTELSREYGREIRGGDVFVEEARAERHTAREWTFIRKDGNRLIVSLVVTAVRDALGNVSGFLGIASDITERKRAEERLRQAAAVFESTREGVMVTDVKRCVLMVNQAFTDITGYTEAEILGKTPSLLSSGRHDRDFYAVLWASVNTSGHWQGEIWNRRKNGEVYPELLSISVVTDESGRLSGYVGVFADISRLKASEAELEFLAHHDPLTQLPNRLLLLSRLDHGIEMARRENRNVALLMLDLDRFKDVNDSFGHLAGDELLQQVSDRLTARLRSVDTVCRMGGDEFTVLLEELAHPEDAARVAESIIAAMSEPWLLSQGYEVRIGTSIGISLFPQYGNTATELLQQADAALYQAKLEGRGCYKYFTEGLTQAARERILLEARLRRAIGQNELRMFYQPQIDIATGRIIGAEALVRWQDPQHGLIPPGRFIPVAEATGLIGAVGEWVLKETCRQGKCWLDAGLPPLILAVNVSPHQFLNSDIAAVVEKVLEETGFPAVQLELELTESALMEREKAAVEMLNRLRAIGVRLAIDDFGTGYSSLSYLKRFPLDVLKIDKSFVDDIPNSEDDMQIAQTIIAIAHALRLQVLAEGVETEAQLDFLREQGCDCYQGYLKSPPVPANKFEIFLKTIVKKEQIL